MYIALTLLGLIVIVAFFLFFYEHKEKPILIFHPSKRNVKIMEKVPTAKVYKAPWIHACSGIVSTLVAEHLRWYPNLNFFREKVGTPDGGFLNILWLDKKQDPTDKTPLLIVFPGISLDTRPPPYAYNLMLHAQRNKWNSVIVHWRGTIDPVQTPKFYSIHDTLDVDFSVNYITSQCPAAQVITVGCSLGSNLVVKWLGEKGSAIPPQIIAGVSVSNPYHVPSVHDWFKQTLIGMMYHSNYLSGMKGLLKRNEEVLLKSPEFRPRYEKALQCSDIWEFDRHFTLHIDPSHQCDCIEDYYKTSSSENYIHQLAVPTLFVSAENDPVGFLREPERWKEHTNTFLCHTQKGGHLSWIRSLKGPSWLDDLVMEFIDSILQHSE